MQFLRDAIVGEISLPHGSSYRWVPAFAGLAVVSNTLLAPGAEATNSGSRTEMR